MSYENFRTEAVSLEEGDMVYVPRVGAVTVSSVSVVAHVVIVRTSEGWWWRFGREERVLVLGGPSESE